jgi:peptide/nickel transport system ATP-binding protein
MLLDNASTTARREPTSDGMAPTLLAVKDLVVRLPTADGGALTIVDGVSFEVGNGDTLGVVGESGSGKTMTALALLRLLPRGAMVTGEILLDGVDLLRLPEREMRRKRGSEIAMILQDPMASLNPAFTIGQQVGEALRIHRGLRGRDLRTATVEILRKVRISEAERRMEN